MGCFFSLKSHRGIFMQLILSIFLTLGSASMAPEADCSDIQEFSGAIEVTRSWNTERNTCSLYIAPRRTPASQYRSYYVDGSGLFVVHNTYGAGPSRTHRSYRDFFILPLQNYMPTYQIESNRDVTVIMVSGHRLRISGRDFSLLEVEPGRVQEKPLARDNNGGVEFMLKEGFWFDGGYKVGASPLSQAQSSSVLRSAKSPSVISCRLSNQKYLDYKGGNYVVRYDGDELIEALRRSCAQLEF